jgi:4-amino-4-deoxy-L-arabinose transferase-like glycosyltransferase
LAAGVRPRLDKAPNLTMHRSPLLWIILAALAIRGGAAFWLQHDLDVVKKRPFLIMGDAEGYWELGQHIADGQPYELYRRFVLRMPGYPVFVAGAIRLSRIVGMPEKDHLIARLLMAAVGALTCGLAAALGKILFDPPTGTLAAAITAVAPPLVGFSVILLSETLFAAALVMSLLCMAKLVAVAGKQEATARLAKWSALTGLTIGLAVYIRPSWLLAAPCFAVLFALWLSRRRSIWDSILTAAIVVACTYGSLAPWAYRNYTITGHWIWTTLWVGPSLYDGFNPQANGESHMEFFEHDNLMNRMSEYDVDHYYREKSWQFMRENPGRALALTFDKLLRFWMPWPNADQFSNVGLKIAVATYFIPVMAAAAAGLIWGPRNPWVWTLTLGPIVYFSCIHTVFLGSLRYRLPAEYPFCIAAAVGFQLLWKRRIGRMQPST